MCPFIDRESSFMLDALVQCPLFASLRLRNKSLVSQQPYLRTRSQRFMELLEYTKHGYSSASSSPRWESRNQIYEYICENSLDVEVADASTAPPVLRTGRRTRYAGAFVLHNRPNPGIMLVSILQISAPLLSPRPPSSHQFRTKASNILSYTCIASFLLTPRLLNILVSTLDARLSAHMPTI